MLLLFKDTTKLNTDSYLQTDSNSLKVLFFQMNSFHVADHALLLREALMALRAFKPFHSLKSHTANVQ